MKRNERAYGLALWIRRESARERERERSRSRERERVCEIDRYMERER
jgi:hypothetical protein